MVCPCTLGVICKQVINFRKEKIQPDLKITWVNIFLSVPLVTISPTDEYHPQHNELLEFVCQGSSFISQIAKVFLLPPYNKVYFNYEISHICLAFLCLSNLKITLESTGETKRICFVQP